MRCVIAPVEPDTPVVPGAMSGELAGAPSIERRVAGARKPAKIPGLGIVGENFLQLRDRQGSGAHGQTTPQNPHSSRYRTVSGLSGSYPPFQKMSSRMCSGASGRSSWILLQQV